MASVRRWAVRGGVGALLAGSIAAGGWGIADAASSGASPSRAPESDTHASAAAATPSPGTRASGAGSTGAPAGQWRGRRGPARFGMIGGVGSITAITSDSITVKSPFGGTRTILTTSETTYVEAMAVVPRSDLKVGESVGVLVKPLATPAGSSTSTSTAAQPTAEAIEIVVPRLAGRVVSVSTSKIVVQGVSGLQQTLVTSGSTTYRELDATVSASAVTAGEDVVGFGRVATDKTELDAGTVAIVGPLAGGKVTGVSGSTITVQSPRGTIRISTNGSTIFRSNSGLSSLGEVKTGDLVLALGLQTSTSSFTASGLWFGTTPGPAGALGIAFCFGSPALGAPTGGSTGKPFGSGGFHGPGSWRPGGFGGFNHSGGVAHGTPGSPPATAGSSSGATTA